MKQQIKPIFIRRVSQFRDKKQIVLPKKINDKVGKYARIEWDEEKKEIKIKFLFQ